MAGFASGAFLRLAEVLGPARPPGRTPSPAAEALRRRDPVAWTHLFEREAPAIYRYVIARVGSREEAEDLVSRTFEEAWKHAEAFEDRGLAPRAWLFGIARHLTSSHRRRLFRQPPVLRLEVVEQAAVGSDPELLDLARAIAGLPPADAEVIVLRFVHGLSAHETAAALGTTVEAVKSRQARALRKLRQALEAPPVGRPGLAAKER